MKDAQQRFRVIFRRKVIFYRSILIPGLAGNNFFRVHRASVAHLSREARQQKAPVKTWGVN